jgi:hypothetical protein
VSLVESLWIVRLEMLCCEGDIVAMPEHGGILGFQDQVTYNTRKEPAACTVLLKLPLLIAHSSLSYSGGTPHFPYHGPTMHVRELSLKAALLTHW